MSLSSSNKQLHDWFDQRKAWFGGVTHTIKPQLCGPVDSSVSVFDAGQSGHPWVDLCNERYQLDDGPVVSGRGKC